MVLVSVVLPSFNHGKFISETIESVLNQTFKDFELIIIDDYSKDNSREIIESYKSEDKRIKTFFHKKNLGIAETVNEGFDRAIGKFIALINSDDVWNLKKLEKQIQVLEKNEDLIVYCEGEIIDDESKLVGINFSQFAFSQFGGITNIKKSGNIFNQLLLGNFILLASIIFKKENIGNLRWNTKLRFLHDYQFETTLASKYNFFFIEEPLVQYRLHDRNTIYSNRIRLYYDMIIVSQYFLKELKKDIPKNFKWLLTINTMIPLILLEKNRYISSFASKLVGIKPLSLASWLYFYKLNLKNRKFILNLLIIIPKFCKRPYSIFKTFRNRYLFKNLTEKFGDPILSKDIIKYIN